MRHTRPFRPVGSRHRRTGTRLAIALAIATVGVAACSSDSKSATSSSASTTAATPTTSAASATTTAGSTAETTAGSTVDTTTGDTTAGTATAGSDAGTTDTATADTTDYSGVTVSHWQHHSDAREAIVKTLISSYQDGGGSKIDFQDIPYSDYFTKLGTALEAGNGPCVFQLPANIINEFQARGQLAPVPDSVMTTAQMEDTFTAPSINLLKIDGKYYGMPTDVQTMLLFYNDDLFKAAGLDPTKDFTTWDEFEQAAIKLTKASGGTMSQAGVDITSSPYEWYYSALALAFKGGFVDDSTQQVLYGSDPGYQVWQRLTDLVTKDKVDDPEFLADQSKFGAGFAGMTLKEYTFNGVYKLSNPDLHFSVHLPPPVADTQYGDAGSTSWSYVVNSACKDQGAAWAWVSYLTSAASEKVWIKDGGELPARKALLNDSTLAADPSVKVGFDSLAKAVPYDSDGWDDTFAVEQQIWDSITLDGADVKTAVDKGAKDEQALYTTKGIGK
ncbi:MAG: hypothetical protein JWM34_1258 [Ilumatobacteraceae bacterium]|nr:hypothetical protein [Ilumatobacteraceae bacterium]